MSTSINLGLERIRHLFAHLPTYTRPTCHIAGTNGKGSVSAMLSSILKASSYRVGRFNSPHLVSVLDSITIDDVPVSQAKYTEIRERIESADRTHGVGASSFELLTATALLIFEDAEVDVAVVEVGMGGRLDATNVLPDQCVLISALTAVDLDHQAFLGTTVAEIAFEKGSIARKGRPFVLGPQTHQDAEDVVRRLVKDVGGHFSTSILPSRRDWDSTIDGQEPYPLLLQASRFCGTAQPVEAAVPPFPTPLRLLLPLPGDHQLDNLGTVLGIISALFRPADDASHRHLNVKEHITPESIANGVRLTSWPGRLSFHKTVLPLPRPNASDQAQPPTSKFLVLADGAHNSSSASTLGNYVAQLVSQSSQAQTATDKPRVITLSLILALSHSPPKTPLQTLSPLFSALNAATFPSFMRFRIRVALLRFSAPDGMPWVRAEAPSDLNATVSSLVPEAEIWTTDEIGTQTHEGLRQALNWAAKGQCGEGGEVGESLIVVAGSLYLVADFYRLLRSHDGAAA